MRLKWIATGLLIGFLVNSCFPLCGCSPEEPDTRINVVVKNSAGEDMLHPATQGYFALNDIEMYYLEPENKVERISGEYSIAIKQGVEFSPDTYDGNLYRLAIQSNYSSSNHGAVTFLKFGNIKTDTLTCFYSGLQITKIEVNSNAVWHSDSQKSKTIEIIADR